MHFDVINGCQQRKLGSSMQESEVRRSLMFLKTIRFTGTVMRRWPSAFEFPYLHLMIFSQYTWLCLCDTKIASEIVDQCDP